MFNSIVMVKQVPDTANITGKVMKDDGTVNRSMLPAIFNHEDKEALELALQVKERYGGTVSVITMGPPRASEMLKECLYMGADKAYLVSDRKFAGSETLATSYVLSEAIKYIGEFDFVFAGRQAIDGDTAQVGPQCAEKLGVPQVTYVEEVISITNDEVVAKRRLSSGVETVSSPLPCLMTVHGASPACRTKEAKRVMQYKYARTNSEIRRDDEFMKSLHAKRPYLTIPEWGVEDIDADVTKIGLPGSPTKVKSVESIVLTASEAKVLTESDLDIESMIKELIDHHIIG